MPARPTLPANPLTALPDAAGALYARALDEVLDTPYAVTTAAEAERLLEPTEETEAVANQIQRVVGLAVPAVRLLARGARFTRVPWVLVASTTVSVGLQVRAGVREVQVLGSLLANRIQAATGAPADRELVQRLTVALYLSPGREPDVAGGARALRRLVRRWMLSGMLGRDSRKRVAKALRAAERLDAAAVARRWQARAR